MEEQRRKKENPQNRTAGEGQNPQESPQNRKAGEGKQGRERLDRSGSFAKKVKLTKDETNWLEMCRVPLSELRAHQDSRPFLNPVNLKAKPWLKRIIKKPMDFSTIGTLLSTNQCLDFKNSSFFKTAKNTMRTIR